MSKNIMGAFKVFAFGIHMLPEVEVGISRQKAYPLG